MQLEEMMWAATKAAIDAGEEILNVYDTDFTVENKSDNSPLTRADMNAHLVISKSLDSTGIPILSEEGKNIPFEERKNWKQFWMVDPLDGTKEFVNRNGEFTVNIAFIDQGFPIAGVIYVPVTDELFIGMPEKGAYKITAAKKRIQRLKNINSLIESGTSLPQDSGTGQYTVVCSRSHMSAETEIFIDELKQTHGDLEFVSKGSSLKLCMVAEGVANIYPRFAPTMEWDTAAGQAIAETSGAHVIQAETGKRLEYNKENLLNPWFIVKR